MVGLTEIPQNLPTNVEALRFSGNMIRHIGANDFLQYKNITLLSLDENCVPRGMYPEDPPCGEDFYIEPGALQHLVNLKWLNLRFNYLREFPRHMPPFISGLDISATQLNDVTAQLQNLTKLTLLFGEINCLRSKAVDICPRNFTLTWSPSANLEVLDLSENNWERIPVQLFGNKLKVFLLMANPVVHLEKSDFIRTPELEVLDLALMGLTTNQEVRIDGGLFDPLAHLRHLNLSGNFIQFLPNEIFKNNKNLQVLDLSSNCLQKSIFQANYLMNLNQIKHLNLAFNNYCGQTKAVDLLRLGPAFTSLTSLERILFGNAANVFPNAVFSVHFHEVDNQSFATLSNLSNLSTIEISYCNVQYISSDAWVGLRHLRSIQASNNLLTFASNLDKATRIENTARDKSLSFSNVDEFEDTVTHCTTQVEGFCDVRGLLSYSNNQIKSISKNKGLLLSKTTILDLSNNQLEKIKVDDLKHLTCLCSIDLSNNPIKTVDYDAFNSFSNLRQMYIIGKETLLDFKFFCHFSPSAQVNLKWKLDKGDLADYVRYWTLSEACDLNSVVELDIAENSLSSLFLVKTKHFLDFLPNLRSLVLRDCDILYTIPKNWFKNLIYLENLDLSHNNLRTFPFKPLLFTKQLKVLNLDYNKINKLKGNISFLINLEVFTIANNHIESIQPGFFSHIQLLKLDLSYNYISRLDPSIFNRRMLETLLYLDFRWNVLDCSCHVWNKFFLWYISDASDNTELPGFYSKCTTEIEEYYGGCVTCQSPLGLRGHAVSRFGHNTSCDFQRDLVYVLTFTTVFVSFLLCGTIGYSSWFRRLIHRKVNEYFRVQSLKPSDVNPYLPKTKSKSGFVFFDYNNDELGDWVDKKLVPGMINGNPSIELLLAGRDIDVGMSTTENLLRLVTKSRKTIVIFSGNFCDNPICRYVLVALQELQYSSGRDQLILVEWHGEVAARVPELIQRTFNRKIYDFLRFDETNDDEEKLCENVINPRHCFGERLRQSPSMNHNRIRKF
ncbi:unnamed protein product [Clavelina lepadiformis]|uniref:TIR domain-containing protein n=1 Tax=Clavelina lepadiformis TaxID=159417 RepID=A0ABP0G581_CLALP